MFYVINKNKIISYITTTATVILLLIMATIFTINDTNLIAASSGVNRKLPIYNVNTNEKKIALTINCAWNADDIDSILDTLSKYNVKVTFFIVGDWADKYGEYVKKISDNGHEIRNT